MTQAQQPPAAPPSGFFAPLKRAWWAFLGSPVTSPNPYDRSVDPMAIKDGLEKRQRLSLWWLTDVPMFFDERSVQKL